MFRVIIPGRGAVMGGVINGGSGAPGGWNRRHPNTRHGKPTTFIIATVATNLQPIYSYSIITLIVPNHINL